jgi:NitT/TauT family transport system substrate-binding protein
MQLFGKINLQIAGLLHKLLSQFIRTMYPLIAMIVFAALALPACQPTAPKPRALTPVTMQLAWTHQAQFAGFYAADQLGYYADEGLAVTFIQGSPNIVPVEIVNQKKAQFGVGAPEQIIQARELGEKVRAVAVIYRRSPRVYMTLAKSGITRPHDFVGKTIAVGKTGNLMLDTMMSNLGIHPDQYTVVQSTSGMASFYNGETQVRAVFLNNEVITARAAGYSINVIYPDDYGIHFYSDTLFTSDELIASDPDLVLRFTRATLKGWTWAVENAARVGPMVIKYNPAADANLENAKMAASLPLVNTGEDHIGWMKPEIWSGMEKILRQQGVLNLPLDVTQVYTMQFLQGIYK